MKNGRGDVVVLHGSDGDVNSECVPHHLGHGRDLVRMSRYDPYDSTTGQSPGGRDAPETAVPRPNPRITLHLICVAAQQRVAGPNPLARSPKRERQRVNATILLAFDPVV